MQFISFVGSVGSMGSMGAVGYVGVVNAVEESPSNPLDTFNPSDTHCFAVAGLCPAIMGSVGSEL